MYRWRRKTCTLPRLLLRWRLLFNGQPHRTGEAGGRSAAVDKSWHPRLTGDRFNRSRHQINPSNRMVRGVRNPKIAPVIEYDALRVIECRSAGRAVETAGGSGSSKR